MIKMDNILVAIDFSPVSEGAAAVALRLSKKQQAELHLLTVDVTQQNSSGDGEVVDALQTVIDKQLRTKGERLVEQARSDQELSVQHKIVRNDAPSAGILQYADTYDIDLIVTGTRGRRGVRRIFQGSVAAEIVRMSPCPVLTVRTGEGNSPDAIRKILVPVDFSVPSRGAVGYGGALAELFDAQLYLVHVLETVDDGEVHGFKPSAFGTAERYRRTKESLYDLAKGVQPEANVQVLEGRPADVITEFAIEQDIDLVIMPTRGQSGWQRLLMGSVAESVITTAPCPVLSARDFDPYLQTADITKDSDPHPQPQPVV